MRFLVSSTLFVLLLALPGMLQPALASPTIDLLALEGDLVAGGNGRVQSFQGFYLLNDESALIATTFLSDEAPGSGDEGVYRFTTTGSVQIAREFQAGPSGTGQFSRFRHAVMNDVGDAVFTASLQGTAAPPEAIFLHRPATGLSEIVSHGQAAPDLNGAFEVFLSEPVTGINNAGRVMFKAELSGTAASNADSTGLFYRDPGGPIVQVARAGDTPPGGEGAFMVNSFEPSPFQTFPSYLNEAGQIAFRGNVAGLSGPSSTRSAIYLTDGMSGLTEVVGKSDPTPDGEDIIDFADLAALNNQAKVAFRAILKDVDNGFTSTGIFLADPAGNLTEIVQTGELIAGTQDQVTELTLPVLNDSDQVAFRAQVNSTGSNPGSSRAIYLADSVNDPIEVIRTGQPALDGNGVVSNLSEPMINARGQLAFRVDFQDTTGGVNDDDAIYFFDPAQGLFQVAREGDPFLNSAIGTLVFTENARVHSSASGFNNDGQVAFYFQLDNTNKGVALWSPPPANLPADLSGDGDVDDEDLGLLFSAFTGPDLSERPLTNPAADLSGDGDVDDEDLGLAFSAFTGPLAPINVPEPASLAWLALGTLILTSRQRGRAKAKDHRKPPETT